MRWQLGSQRFLEKVIDVKITFAQVCIEEIVVKWDEFKSHLSSGKFVWTIQRGGTKQVKYDMHGFRLFVIQ